MNIVGFVGHLVCCCYSTQLCIEKSAIDNTAIDKNRHDEFDQLDLQTQVEAWMWPTAIVC